jgi:hypothetical protein
MQVPLDLKGSKTRDEIRRLRNDGPMRAAMPPEFYEQKGNDDGVKEVEVKRILTEFHFPRAHSVRYPHLSFHFSTAISITLCIDGYLCA